MEDWDDYRFFLAVAKKGSFSGAARLLKVSQPTVSRRINQLEERLNVRLFDQLPTGVKLTSMANEILGVAEGLEHKANELKRRVEGRDSQAAGPISVTATQSFASLWLAEKLAKFSGNYPNITVTCLADNRALNLIKREADLAIRFGQPESSSLIGSRIGYVHCGIYGSKEYFETHGEPESLQDLKDHKLIDTLDPVARFRQSQDLKKMMSESHVSCRTNCPLTYLALAKAGKGLICTSCYMVAHSPGLQRVLQDQYDLRIELWLLMHPDIRSSKRVRLVMDFIRTEVRADRCILEGK